LWQEGVAVGAECGNHPVRDRIARRLLALFGERVDEDAVGAQAVVEVGAGRRAGRADAADDLTLIDGIRWRQGVIGLPSGEREVKGPLPEGDRRATVRSRVGETDRQ
jgi:hypothetical protein